MFKNQCFHFHYVRVFRVYSNRFRCKIQTTHFDKDVLIIKNKDYSSYFLLSNTTMSDSSKLGADETLPACFFGNGST